MKARLCLLIALAALTSSACNTVSANAAEATWRSEQPIPSGSSWPIALGTVGDIEFFAPNRGLLISAGTPPTVSPGVWVYNGVEWRQLASVCGASDGSIAWAGPEEFWTVSDGRPGQTSLKRGGTEEAAPLQNNTLCHFANGQVAASYAHLAFEPSSYQEMHGAACVSPNDCWFGGNPLAEPQIGAFHLHWNGSSLEEEPYPAEGHPIESMEAFEGAIFESVRVSAADRESGEVVSAPVVHRINPNGFSPVFEAEDEGGAGLPLYAPTELPRALDYLHLSTADGTLWAVAGRKFGEEEPSHAPGQVTIAVRESGFWRQLVGPTHPLPPIMPANSTEEVHLLGGEARNALVTAAAAEPGSESVWIGLHERGNVNGGPAVLARVSAEGQMLEAQTLPSAQEQLEGIGPKGPAASITCPAANDCWMATTQGWLFHLAPEGERTLPRDTDPNLSGLITFRPPDQGLPQITADAPPPDTSGLTEESATPGVIPEAHEPENNKVALPLLSKEHSRLIHGSTLELRFHLAVKARVRLVALRKKRTIAATGTHTFKAGTHALQLRLDPKRWPTKLELQTHALAPLPVVSSVTGEGSNISTETTGLHALDEPSALLQAGSGLLR
jgi:hypothetical protein